MPSGGDKRPHMIGTPKVILWSKCMHAVRNQMGRSACPLILAVASCWRMHLHHTPPSEPLLHHTHAHAPPLHRHWSRCCIICMRLHYIAIGAPAASYACASMMSSYPGSDGGRSVGSHCCGGQSFFLPTSSSPCSPLPPSLSSSSSSS